MGTTRTVSCLFVCLVALAGCASLPDISARTESYAVAAHRDPALDAKLVGFSRATGAKSSFMPIEGGMDAFVARAALARRAQHTIDAQYFLLRDDKAGKLFISYLAEAADRGVRVRLLIDDFALGGRHDSRLLALDAHPDIHVRSFNPLSRAGPRLPQFATRFGTATRRMHNKTFIVDNRAAIVGGRNVGDKDFATRPDRRLADLDMLVAGPVVSEISHSFDTYWNSDLAYPIAVLANPKPHLALARAQQPKRDVTRLQDDPPPYSADLQGLDVDVRPRHDQMQVFHGPARAFSDDPRKVTNKRDPSHFGVAEKIDTALSQATKEVTIITPYFIPGRVGVHTLTAMVAEGVRVRVLTNGVDTINYHFVHAHYAKYRRALLAGGVELYEARVDEGDDQYGLENWRLMHAKALIIDRARVFVGSFNFDPRSVFENTEIAVVYESPAFAQSLSTSLDRDLDSMAYRLRLTSDLAQPGAIVWETRVDGEIRTSYREPRNGPVRRLKTGVYRLLPIESML